VRKVLEKPKVETQIPFVGKKMIENYRRADLGENVDGLKMDAEIEKLGKVDIGPRRLPHEKVEFPKFRGDKDRQSPLNFWHDLMRYKSTFQISDSHMLASVIPFALIEDAKSWFDLKFPFGSFSNFQTAFFNSFVPLSMMHELIRTLNTARQRPDEKFPDFVMKMNKLFELTNSELSDIAKVDHVMNALHPDYLIHIPVNAKIESLSELFDLSLQISHRVFRSKNYKPSKRSDFALTDY